MNAVQLSFRFLLREWRAGELYVLLLAVIIAVASVTTVSFFTDRVQLALANQANQLLGADLVVISDHEPDPALIQESKTQGLKASHTVTFPSMVLKGEQSQLAEIKAVSEGYPLRGQLRTENNQQSGAAIPPAGTAWVEPRLLNQLGLNVGDTIELGALRLKIAAVITQEPDRGGDFFSIAPRLMLNLDDLPASGLIQPGSRASYRTLIAGEPSAVAKYRTWAAYRIGRGERIEGVQDARPEIRSALERAQKYLGLAALVSAVLSAVAVAVAARRFMQRHLDSCAVMRCVGASQSLIFGIYLFQFVWLGLLASLIGSALGYAAQRVLSYWLSALVAGDLPQPSLLPAVEGVITGMALLMAFSLPPLLRLRKVPALRVLRREFGAPEHFSLLGYAFGLAVIAAMLIRKAGDLALGLYALSGLLASMLLAAAITWSLIRLIGGIRRYAGSSWFYGLSNITRRGWGSVAQVVAFGLGMMALLLLTLVRGDLMHSWQTTLPPDAPNRFVINIQPDQMMLLRQYFVLQGLADPNIYPMVRGRLVAINDKPVSADSFTDDRAKKLVDREFNLSWASLMHQDNRIVSGKWWRKSDIGKPWLSVEEGIAKTLGLKLGDKLTYEVAGSRFTSIITNLRKVNWDSFNVNFFVLTPPGVLETYPASYITSFYLPQNNGMFLNRMVKNFPNVTVIDVAAVMAQVRDIMDRVASAVEFVFLFTLLAGLMVLYAAIVSSQDERLYESAIWRTLGASRRQLLAAQLTEFATIGVLAGFVAALGASGAGYVLSTRVLDLPFSFSPWLWITGMVSGGAGVAFAGWLGTRKTLNQPPLQILRNA